MTPLGADEQHDDPRIQRIAELYAELLDEAMLSENPYARAKLNQDLAFCGLMSMTAARESAAELVRLGWNPDA